MSDALTLLATLAIGFMVVVWLFVFFVFFKIWVRALMSGYRVEFPRLVGMKLRRIPPGLIVDAFIRGRNADLDISIEQLEKHYLAGGDVPKVIDAMIKARNRDMDVPFEAVAKADLAGYDLETVGPEEG